MAPNVLEGCEPQLHGCLATGRMGSQWNLRAHCASSRLSVFHLDKRGTCAEGRRSGGRRRQRQGKTIWIFKDGIGQSVHSSMILGHEHAREDGFDARSRLHTPTVDHGHRLWIYVWGRVSRLLLRYEVLSARRSCGHGELMTSAQTSKASQRMWIVMSYAGECCMCLNT
ncbi:hypothetical protein PHLGIDRAFT_146315 [Phlebiopsis gigantea 11061_1 CR5-6]|uniref:Uncharacterized protein n=1 Tax=Phlebiopsis gigantea (strain 11061_1 CR5-6) TaxID=745531 RepID=A0A0C3RVX1_PHLG1|nr:hypothetical protein PHLGIDRAFT_146315 [Phlebiopsis gigantea 11061_1 CR5-6]